MKLSIVIPVFNEEALVETTHKRLVSLMKELSAGGYIDEYEIIYVDDGSTDDSLGILKRFSMESRMIKVLSFSRNFGHQPALAAGILHSSGDAVVSLDADLQDPPELIKDMLDKFGSGKDIVYAVRRERRTDSPFKRWTARFFYRMMRFMGTDIIYDHADYRMISKRVVEAFREVKEVNIFLRGIFPYLGFEHDIIHYDREMRVAGVTKYPLIRMISFAWEGVTSFSMLPLRIAFLTGLIISFFSVILVVWAFYVKMAGKTIPGWASIVIPMFFIGGLNILFLGLIGEYVGKIYLEAKKRPLFIIKEQHNIETERQ